MANMRMDKNPMPEQDPVVRAGNFDEVALGYTPGDGNGRGQSAASTATTCPACRTGCPVSVRIPSSSPRSQRATLTQHMRSSPPPTPLPAVCYRVCPQEKQCESKVRSRYQGRERRHRSPRALCRRLPHEQGSQGRGQGSRIQRSPHRDASAPALPALTCAGDPRKMATTSPF